jgi:hypothetical protein
MTAIQTFGVTTQDVQDRVQGLSDSASSRGPRPSGFDDAIRRAAASLCGELVGAQLPILASESENEVLWSVCRSAVISYAAYIVLSARNRGAPEASVMMLRQDYRDHVEIIRRSPQRTGQDPTSPGPKTFSDGLTEFPQAYNAGPGNGFAFGRRGL